MRSKVRICPQSLPFGFQNEIMDHPCLDGGPKANASNIPNLMKDVPNFMKDVPRVPK